MKQRQDWQLRYQDLAKGKKGYGQESLLSLGNGFIGWRGAPIWAEQSADHYPGLYLAGVFNQTQTPLAGNTVVNEDLVNLPNPQLLKIRVNGHALSDYPIEDSQRQLDFRQGELQESYVFGLPEGKLTLTSKKVVDPWQWHNLGLTVTITTTFKAQVDIDWRVDTTVENQNVARYRDFETREFDLIKADAQRSQVLVKTRQSAITIGLGVSSHCRYQGIDWPLVVSAADDGLHAQNRVTLVADQAMTLTRQVSLATTLETRAPLTDFLAQQQDQTSWSSILDHSRHHWHHFWQSADVRVKTDEPELQMLIRLNIFQLHQAAQWPANEHLDASVGSRGLTGEGYRGHIFWDELFVLPYYAANSPRTARALLHYRIQRLAPAMANAEREGEMGALYPWQSAQYGDEQAQLVHLNPLNQAWEPDNSRLQRHINLAIIYDFWAYVKASGDQSILSAGGLAVILEIVKYWLNKVKLAADGRYDLTGVMGPDEFHEAYPGSPAQGGFTNNTYTNVMLAWALDWVLSLQEALPDFAALAQQANFNSVLLEKADQVRRRLRLEQNSAGILAQFAGYFDLKRLDLAAYQAKYGDIHRIDRLLKAEGQSPDDYQVAKQADVLMLIYNLGVAEVERILSQLGYPPATDWLASNLAYYRQRTVHGSTTSRPVFALIEAQLGLEKEAHTDFVTALRSDYDDIQGGTTAEGLHLGVMGETLTLIERDFGGVKLDQGRFDLWPALPTNWQSLTFNQRYQGKLISVTLAHDRVWLAANEAITIWVQGRPVYVEPNKVCECVLLKEVRDS